MAPDLGGDGADLLAPFGSSPQEVALLCLRGLLTGPDAVIYVKDLQSRFVMVSDATAAKHGLSPEQMLGLTDAELFDSAHSEFALAEERRIMTTGEATAFKEVHETWTDREESWAITSKRPLRDADGRIVGLVGISQDATSRVLAERRAAEALAELSAVEAVLRTLLENSPDAILRIDPDQRITFANAAAQHLLRRPGSEVIGRTVGELGLDKALAEPWTEAWTAVLASGEGTVTEARTSGAGDAAWLHCRMAAERDAGGTVVSVLTSARDITELKRAEEVMARQAFTDAVTGLANRSLLVDRLRQALVRLDRRPAHVALLFVDLDHFKEVNDTHGHHVGDQVLVEMARRLRSVARRDDTVARLGGDEFVVLCPVITEPAGVRALARRVVLAAAAPMVLDGLTVTISASVGVVVTDDGARDPAELMRSADAAMYRAKRTGRNGYRIWDAGSDPGRSS